MPADRHADQPREALRRRWSSATARIYWCAEHLDDPRAAAILDVTDLGYHAAPVGEDVACATSSRRYAEREGTVRLAGDVINPLGRITAGQPAHGDAGVLRPPPGARCQPSAFPVGARSTRGRRSSPGRPRPPLAASCARSGSSTPCGTCGCTWTWTARAPRRAAHRQRHRSRRSRRGAGTAAADPAGRRPPRAGGLVAKRPPRLPSRRRQGGQAHHAHAAAPRQGCAGPVAPRPGCREAKALRRTGSPPATKIRVYHRRVPSGCRSRRARSSSRATWASSTATARGHLRGAAARRAWTFSAIWSYADEPEGFPKDASWCAAVLAVPRALARAEYWVDNQGLPAELAKRPADHLHPDLARLGVQADGLRRAGGQAQARGRAGGRSGLVDRFDHFLVRSEHDVRTLAKGLPAAEGRSCCGRATRATTRSSRGRDADDRRPAAQALASWLGIRRTARSCSTRRPSARRRTARPARGSSSPSTWSASRDELGDRYVLLVRAALPEHVVLPPSVRGTGHRRVATTTTSRRCCCSPTR